MDRVVGELHVEGCGPVDAQPMVFLHPNPADGSFWHYQVAHFSTWFRCVTIDLPGYGRSPGVASGTTLAEIAEACWQAVPQVAQAERAVIVGCSVGSWVAEHMYHRRPEATDAVVLSGTGWYSEKHFVARRVAEFRSRGAAFRREYALDLLAEDFRSSPIATWFADMLDERSAHIDIDGVIAMFEALEEPDPPWLHRDLYAPVLILSGTEDVAHTEALELRDRLPDVEMTAIEGAGHACNIERPDVFDREILHFLRERCLLR